MSPEGQPRPWFRYSARAPLLTRSPNAPNRVLAPRPSQQPSDGSLSIIINVLAVSVRNRTDWRCSSSSMEPHGHIACLSRTHSHSGALCTSCRLIDRVDAIVFRLIGFAICTGLLTAIVHFAILVTVRMLFSLKPQSLTGQLVTYIARRGTK